MPLLPKDRSGTRIEEDNKSILDTVAHRPFDRPSGLWTMKQRWNDLLFAHWPVPVATMAALLPVGLEVDTFDGHAWAGIVPFWMDRVRVRVPGTTDHTLFFPSVETFPELNLRTYVRSSKTGRAGVFFFSLDAASPLAVAGARTIFHLPYFFASMSRTTDRNGLVDYRSRRLLTRREVMFEATYRGLGRASDAAPSQAGSIEHFLTERYCLFTTFRNRVLVGNIHHLPWPLEPAEAEFRVNQLPTAHGLTLPDRPPVLHFSRALEVYIWSLKPDGSV
jgi:uncharacterized protein YqjF (DUF2071 family)